jgi:hypothetical protein
MMSTTDNTQEFYSACRGMLAKFFDSFPDEAFRSIACQSLETFLAQCQHREGKPGGWTGGLVHALAKDIGPGVIGRFETGHREALQNQPVGFMLVNVAGL